MTTGEKFSDPILVSTMTVIMNIGENPKLFKNIEMKLLMTLPSNLSSTDF